MFYLAKGGAQSFSSAGSRNIFTPTRVPRRLVQCVTNNQIKSRLLKAATIVFVVLAIPFMLLSQRSLLQYEDPVILEQIRSRTGPMRMELQNKLSKIHHLLFPVKYDSMQFKKNHTEPDRLTQKVGQKVAAQSLPSTLFVLRGYAKGAYFENAGHFPKLKTMKLSTNFERIVHLLVPNLYTAVTNMCGTNLTGSYNNFHLQCTREMNSGIVQTPFPLTSSYVTVGLPQNTLEVDSEQLLAFLHVLQDAFVFPEGDVISNDVKIVPQRCQAVAEARYPHQVYHLDRIPIYDQVFTIGQYWGEGFYHFTVEDLPRLTPFLPFLIENLHIQIHITIYKGFAVNLLEQLGISKTRIIYGQIRAKTLYMPSGSLCGAGVPFHLQLLSMQFRVILPPPQIRSTILLVYRSKKRFFVKHSDILNMLEEMAHEYDLTVEVFYDNPAPTLQESMVMFNRALVIVAPHGAGLSNVIFAEPGTMVIEGLCMEPTKSNMCYANLSQMLGMRYFGIPPSGECGGGYGLAAGATQVEKPLRIFLQSQLV